MLKIRLWDLVQFGGPRSCFHLVKRDNAVFEHDRHAVEWPEVGQVSRTLGIGGTVSRDLPSPARLLDLLIQGPCYRLGIRIDLDDGPKVIIHLVDALGVGFDEVEHRKPAIVKTRGDVFERDVEEGRESRRGRC